VVIVLGKGSDGAVEEATARARGGGDVALVHQAGDREADVLGAAGDLALDLSP
jgi:hypothetical protein